MTRIAVIDHGAGNLVSIGQGLVAAGGEVRVITGPDGLAGADAAVLPGVGATGAAMARLEAAGLAVAIRDWDGPLLGICVGLQLFFDRSDEDDGPCLGLISGTVRRLDGAPRLPHIGWNDIALSGEDPLFTGIEDATPFYFVHSYAPIPDDPAAVIARAHYGDHFPVAVRDGRRVGVQFHPERSGRDGLAVLANFVAECRDAA